MHTEQHMLELRLTCPCAASMPAAAPTSLPTLAHPPARDRTRQSPRRLVCPSRHAAFECGLRLLAPRPAAHPWGLTVMGVEGSRAGHEELSKHDGLAPSWASAWQVQRVPEERRAADRTCHSSQVHKALAAARQPLHVLGCRGGGGHQQHQLQPIRCCCMLQRRQLLLRKVGDQQTCNRRASTDDCNRPATSSCTQEA